MVKLIACIFIIAGSSAVGILKAGELKKRLNFLDSIISSLKIIGNNIENSNMDMNGLLNRLSQIEQFRDNSFYGDIGKYLSENKTLDISVHNAVENLKAKYYITAEDAVNIECIKEIFMAHDRGEAVINCNRCEEMLRLARDNAQDIITNRSRLYRTFGVLLGIIVVIMLI